MVMNAIGMKKISNQDVLALTETQKTVWDQQQSTVVTVEGDLTP